jgi:hypothetical protein
MNRLLIGWIETLILIVSPIALWIAAASGARATTGLIPATDVPIRPGPVFHGPSGPWHRTCIYRVSPSLLARAVVLS